MTTATKREKQNESFDFNLPKVDNGSKKEKNQKYYGNSESIPMDIIKKYAVLSSWRSYDGTDATKEFNFVSWNNKKPVYDLRNWFRDSEDSDPRAGKGITLTLNDIKMLYDIFAEIIEAHNDEESK